VPSYQEEVRLLTESEFDTWMRPRVAKRNRKTGEVIQFKDLAAYQFKSGGVTHYSVVRHEGIDWVFKKAGSLENMKPSEDGQLRAIEVQEFENKGFPPAVMGRNMSKLQVNTCLAMGVSTC